MVARALVSLVVLVLAQASLGQPEYPDSTLGRIASAFIEAFNSADEATIIEFEERYQSMQKLAERSAQERAESLMGAATTMGTLEVETIEELENGALRVVVDPSKLPIWLKCTFELDESEPGKFSSIRIEQAAEPLREGDVDWARDGWGDLTELVGRAAESTGVPALAVVVMRDGEITSEAVAGVRAVGVEGDAKLDDRFHVGSITKSMTATVIARLIERGELDWETTIADALPDMDVREEYREVTIEQLLQHRAGLVPGTGGSETIYEFELPAEASTAEQRRAFVQHALKTDPVGTIGGQTLYSNVGYVVAGCIAERAAGKSWSDLVREEVFEPFGVESGGFGWPGTGSEPGQPVGHVADGDGYRTASEDYVLGADIAPAGNVHCSPRDLARYGHGHMMGLLGEGGALRAETIKRLHTPLIEAGMPYACGWMVRDVRRVGEVHWHNGSAGTYFAVMEVYPEIGLVIVIVTNVGLEGQVIADKLIGAIRTREIKR